MRRRGAAVLVFAAIAMNAAADVPVRMEQVIYSVVAFNGKDYSPTFVPAVSDTIYTIANTDNFFSVRDTFVYWWPPAEMAGGNQRLQ